MGARARCDARPSALYINTGRTAEWARLIDEAQPLVVDPGSTEPRGDRVDGWTVLAKHRVRLAQWNRDFDGAEVLLRKRIDHDRRLAADALATSPDKLSDGQRHRLDRLSSSVHELAETLRLRRSPACVPLYREAINLIVRADEKGESILTYNLASALLEIPEVRDIDEAERLYLRSLELLPSADAFRRALSYASLGHIAIERYDEAVAYGEAERILQRHLADANLATRWLKTSSRRARRGRGPSSTTASAFSGPRSVVWMRLSIISNAQPSWRSGSGAGGAPGWPGAMRPKC